MATWHNLSIFIDTDIFALMFVTVMRSHQVSIVLPGPTGRAPVGCWDHQLRTAWSDVTHGARSIMVVDIIGEAWKVSCLILSTIYSRCTLPAAGVFVVYGIVGQTEEVGATTLVVEEAAPHEPCYQKDRQN